MRREGARRGAAGGNSSANIGCLLLVQHARGPSACGSGPLSAPAGLGKSCAPRGEPAAHCGVTDQPVAGNIRLCSRVGPRADGWTPRRQAAFIGYLAETGSVLAAARRVSMGRESAYRLRKRRGGAGFAAAWDAAIGKPHTPVDLSSAKSTGLPAAWRCHAGLMTVVMSAGRFQGSYCKDDANALMQHLARLDRATQHMPEFEGKSHALNPGEASTGGPDLGDAPHAQPYTPFGDPLRQPAALPVAPRAPQCKSLTVRPNRSIQPEGDPA